MTSGPRVLPGTSLIVCTRNRHDLLRDSVASIARSDALPAELLIIDQSDARWEGVIDFAGSMGGCDLRYIHSSTRGLSRARNEGLERARYDILAFTDDDVLAPADWFRTVVEALEQSGERSVVTGRVLPAESERPGGYVPTLKTGELATIFTGRLDADPLVTFNMAMRRRAVEEIGEFDPTLGPGTRFPGGEDNDYGYRLLRAGYRIVYVPSAILYHRAWRTAGSYLPLRWGYGRGQGAFLAKHARRGDKHAFMRFVRRLFGVAGRMVPRWLISKEREPGRDLPRWALVAGDLYYLAGLITAFTERLLLPPGMFRASGSRDSGRSLSWSRR